ncbi:unnamed protein product [Protopolystoma xenopodis]|uniref:Uncharacterized protein n=1 Tax=Protopolystoma xenopodis TaxID=117903 RepID=A0A3S5AZF5_9PLAT|nr:unnamed protein product [Protopolystoma xenopodis]
MSPFASVYHTSSARLVAQLPPCLTSHLYSDNFIKTHADQQTHTHRYTYILQAPSYSCTINWPVGQSDSLHARPQATHSAVQYVCCCHIQHDIHAVCLPYTSILLHRLPSSPNPTPTRRPSIFPSLTRHPLYYTLPSVYNAARYQSDRKLDFLLSTSVFSPSFTSRLLASAF